MTNRSIYACFCLLFGILAAASISNYAASPSARSEKTSAHTEQASEPVEKRTTAPQVRLTTNLGNIILELDAEQAPVSVENFLSYVKSGFYDGTIFHRVMRGFMIQGGGFTAEMKKKPTRSPIKNEAGNGLSNKRYTLAMARTRSPDSATAQFYINLVDNDFLDKSGPLPQQAGYAVFGRVVDGTDVVDKIAEASTKRMGPHESVPQTPIIIEKAAVIE